MLSSTIILFPFANQLVKLSGFFIDDSAEEHKDDVIKECVYKPNDAMEYITVEIKDKKEENKN